MSETTPFIPRDKPRSWVVGVLAALSGLGAGLIAFSAAVLGIKMIKFIAIIIFVVCWATFAISWVVFVSGLISGRYTNLVARDWRDQVW